MCPNLVASAWQHRSSADLLQFLLKNVHDLLTSTLSLIRLNMGKEEVMARSDTRYSVYPTPRAIDVVGNSAPALNQAIECWAALLARAMADNDRTFEQADRVEMHFERKMWQMNEWALMAEALKDMRFDSEFTNPGQLLATAVEDAHRLEYIGAKCLDWGECDSTIIKEKHIDAAVNKVVEKLRNLDYVHAWAVIVAVQWFWEHHDEGIDIKENPWWTLPFRRQWKERHASKQGAGGTEGQQPATEGRKRKRRGPSKGRVGTEGR